MPKFKNLEQWFDRLVRNKMRGPALVTAGIAIGLVIMAAGLLPWGRPAQDVLLIVGLVQVACLSVLFVAFAALEFYKSL